MLGSWSLGTFYRSLVYAHFAFLVYNTYSDTPNRSNEGNFVPDSRKGIFCGGKFNTGNLADCRCQGGVQWVLGN